MLNLSTFFSHSPVSSFRVSYRKASSPTWTTMEVRFVYFDQPVFALLKKGLLSLMFATGGPLALLNLDLLAGHRPPLPPLRGHSIPGAITQMTKIMEQREKQRLYQARVQTRNQFGFSKPDQVFNFATKGAGEIVRLCFFLLQRCYFPEWWNFHSYI